MLGLVRLRMVRAAISKYSTVRLASRSWLSAASRAIPTSAIGLFSLFLRLLARGKEHTLAAGSVAYPKRRPGGLRNVGEGFAGVEVAGIKTAAKPRVAFVGGAVSESLRAHVAGAHALQTVVADRSRRTQAGSDVAGVDDLALLG